MSKTQPHTDQTPQTSHDSYRAIRDTAADAGLRKRVCAAIALEPSTTKETKQALGDASLNAVRPRINELIRMGCVRREGKRENPSGMDAYIHHVTPTGKAYLEGDVDPEVAPPLSELQRNVVEVARAFCAGDVEQATLRDAVSEHDTIKKQRNPEWTPMTTETNTDTPSIDDLTDEQIEQIKADPVLQLSDFE